MKPIEMIWKSSDQNSNTDIYCFPFANNSAGGNLDHTRGAKRLDEQARDDLEDMLRHLTRDR